jgi:hypothetical protein
MMGKRRTGRPGTSIVEILVAMVILVIGIFGIIRVFPTGFSIIAYGENVSLSEKMANAALEQARANAASLPDAVLPIDPTTGALDATMSPSTEAHDFREPSPPLDTRFDPPRYDARFYGLNRTRRVFGETTKIPSPTPDLPYMPIDPTTNRRELISLYTAQFGPLYSATIQPPGLGGLVVYSGQALQRVVVTQDPTPQEATDYGFGRYGVNYAQRRLYFAPTPSDRRFKIQYSYTVADPSGPFRAQSLPGQFIPVPAGQIMVDLSGLLPNNAVLEQGEEIVSRAFTEVPLATLFSEIDPYQYKLINSFTGTIGFNPRATLVPGVGSRGITAKIDYDVDDWHIVKEDRLIPAEAPYRVKLTLGFLKRAGDTQEDQELYTGLRVGYPDRPGLLGRPPLNNIDVVVVDLDTGFTIDSRTLQPEAAADNGAIDYRAGRIDFEPTVQWALPNPVQWSLPSPLLAADPGGRRPIGGRHVRIYYRTENDFALQLQKAFTSYLRSLIPTTVTPGQYGQLPHGFLLFPGSDNNQTVLVDYTFTDQRDGRRVTVSGEMQPIRPPTDLDSPQNLMANVARPTDWFIRLNNSSRISPTDPVGRAEVMPGSIVIHSVRGVSVRSRVAWREGNRWRRLENSTYLTRPGT